MNEKPVRQINDFSALPKRALPKPQSPSDCTGAADNVFSNALDEKDTAKRILEGDFNRPPNSSLNGPPPLIREI